MRFMDGLRSVATHLGTVSDKLFTANYDFKQLSVQELEAAFRSSWVCKKAVTLPAFDATRKWREWSGNDSQAIDDAEAEFGLRQKVYEALWKSRLHGRAYILIGIPSDPDWLEPLDGESVSAGGLDYLTVLGRPEVAEGPIVRDPRSPYFGQPEYYRLRLSTGQSDRIHPSRMAIFVGDPFSDSVLQSIYDACRQLDSTLSNVASLIFDAKTDIIKIPELTTLSETDKNFEQNLINRGQVQKMLKGNHGILYMDKEEEYESKSYSFSGLDSVMDRFMQTASGAADIPMTRFLSQSPGGLNSTGDSDHQNYEDSLAAKQTLEIGPALKTLDTVLVLSTLGSWPNDLDYEWRPLRQMTEQQISEIRNRDADTLAKLAGTRVYADEDIAEVGIQMFREKGIDGLEVPTAAEITPPEDDDEDDQFR